MHIQEFIYFLLLYPIVRVWINNGLSVEKYIPDEPETPTIVRPENKTFISPNIKEEMCVCVCLYVCFAGMLVISVSACRFVISFP